MLNRMIHFLAFGFGFGLIPYAPGTFGTIVGVVIYILLLKKLTLSAYIISLILTTMLGIYLCGKTARDYYVHDHPSIVWDEMVGFWITMLFAPTINWIWIIAAFALFRFFDILKPWPIRWLDKNIKGGLGIMIDDIAAALMAGISLITINTILNFINNNSAG